MNFPVVLALAFSLLALSEGAFRMTVTGNGRGKATFTCAVVGNVNSQAGYSYRTVMYITDSKLYSSHSKQHGMSGVIVKRGQVGSSRSASMSVSNIFSFGLTTIHITCNRESTYNGNRNIVNQCYSNIPINSIKNYGSKTISVQCQSFDKDIFVTTGNSRKITPSKQEYKLIISRTTSYSGRTQFSYTCIDNSQKSMYRRVSTSDRLTILFKNGGSRMAQIPEGRNFNIYKYDDYKYRYTSMSTSLDVYCYKTYSPSGTDTQHINLRGASNVVQNGMSTVNDKLGYECFIRLSKYVLDNMSNYATVRMNCATFNTP